MSLKSGKKDHLNPCHFNCDLLFERLKWNYSIHYFAPCPWFRVIRSVKFIISQMKIKLYCFTWLEYLYRVLNFGTLWRLCMHDDIIIQNMVFRVGGKWKRNCRKFWLTYAHAIISMHVLANKYINLNNTDVDYNITTI
jgi:hypothetical protein